LRSPADTREADGDDPGEAGVSNRAELSFGMRAVAASGGVMADAAWRDGATLSDGTSVMRTKVPNGRDTVGDVGAAAALGKEPQGLRGPAREPMTSPASAARGG
jgi:hypothetical protein